MKKIIAFTSFLFLLLLAALPGQVSHAAAATNANSVKLTGITLVTVDSNGKEYKTNALKKGDNFVFNLKYVNQTFDRVEFTSDSATTVSLLPYGDENYSDDTDLHFVNGIATLDKAKFTNWVLKLNAEDSEYSVDPAQVDELFTSDGLRNIRDMFADLDENDKPVPFSLYTTDGNGNFAEQTVAIKDYGWKKINNKWYYNDEDQTVKGWVLDDNGKWYFLDKTTGIMKEGWLLSGGKWYYLAPVSGDMETGWQKVNGKWYFLDKTNGDMKTGWVKDGSKWYFLDKTNGDMKTGWVKDGGKWYFLSNSGAMQTGWVLYKNQWYYLNNPSGAMATGWVQVSSKWYFLYNDGHMAKNTWIGKYKLGASGAWIH